jgi:hypothetical protein
MPLLLFSAWVWGLYVPSTYGDNLSCDLPKEDAGCQHWDILTAHVANRLRDSLIGSGEQGRPIALYVQQPKYNSDFGEAFHNLLITHLMERGFSIS